ncbi:hypothetical protein HWI79_1543 [Cryptosporidium felis]|nr:hypothetical protein HWI79_1543 [Cryptosporidium felis]
MYDPKRLILVSIYLMFPFSFCNKVLGQHREVVNNFSNVNEGVVNKNLFPLVSLEIKTQQLKLEGEILGSGIVSRRVLIAKGVIESRLLTEDVLHFNTSLINNDKIEMKGLVGIVSYYKRSKEEPLYSSCNGVIRNILPTGFYEFETVFFKVYCDMDKSLLYSYLGINVFPLNGANKTFVKEGNISKETFSGKYYYPRRFENIINEPNGNKKTVRRLGTITEFRDNSDIHTDSQLVSTSLSKSMDSILQSTRGSGEVVRRGGFIHKNPSNVDGKQSDGSLTRKLRAYRKSLEVLKQSATRIKEASAEERVSKHKDRESLKSEMNKTSSREYRESLRLVLIISFLPFLFLLWQLDNYFSR